MIGAVNEGCQNIFRIFKKLSVLVSEMISQSFVLAQDVLVVHRVGGDKKNCSWEWMSRGLSHTCFICFQRRTFSLCNGAQSPSCLRCCSLRVTPPSFPTPLRFRLDLWLEGNVSPTARHDDSLEQAPTSDLPEATWWGCLLAQPWWN